MKNGQIKGINTIRQDVFLSNLNGVDELKIKKLKENFTNKKIAIIGCGGVGSPISELLVRGGFSNIVLIDNDIIDETNLQRQIFFNSDIGSFKSVVLGEQLKKINPNLNVKTIVDLIDLNNIDSYLNDVDFIVDATDDFKIRRLINDFSIKKNIFWQYNGAIKSEISTCIFSPKNNKFDKLFPKHVENVTCCDVGVLSSTTFGAASIAYQEILKYFVLDEFNNFIKFDIWNFKIYNYKI